MNTTEIEEGNSLIALFIGFILIDSDLYKPDKKMDQFYNWAYNNNGLLNAIELEFDSSWEKLMYVVEKIEAIKNDYHGHFGVHIVSNTCTIQATNFRPDKKITDPPHYFAHYVLKSKMEATWVAVVNFIKWYNAEHEVSSNSD